MANYRKPGAPLGRSTQAALYYARKRRRARIAGEDVVPPDDEIRISAVSALGVELLSDFDFEMQMVAAAEVGVGVTTGFNLSKSITATNHALGAGQAVSVSVSISLQATAQVGADLAATFTPFHDIRANASLGYDESAAVVASFNPVFSATPNLGADLAAALATFASITSSQALGAGMAVSLDKTISIRALPGLGASMAATVSATSNPVVSAYVTNDYAIPSSMPHTFTGISIGTAASDRFIVIGIGRRLGTSVTGVTLGGNAMTRIAGVDATTASLWMIKITTGTTANLVVSGAGTPQLLGYSVFRLTGVKDTGTISDSVVQGSTGTGSSPQSLTLNAVNNGYAIGVSARSASATCTWSGAVEDFDNNSSGSLAWSGGSVATQTGSNITSGQFTMSANQGLANNVVAGATFYPV